LGKMVKLLRLLGIKKGITWKEDIQR